MDRTCTSDIAIVWQPHSEPSQGLVPQHKYIEGTHLPMLCGPENVTTLVLEARSMSC